MFMDVKRNLNTLLNIMNRAVRFFYTRIFESNISYGINQRRGLLVNILLFVNILFSVLTSILITYATLTSKDPSGRGLPIIIPIFITIFFVLLLIISKKGYFKFSAFCLMAIYYLVATYMIFSWGIDLTSAILIYALVVIMSGILISTRFTLYSTIIIAITLFVIGNLQLSNIVVVNNYWKQEPFNYNDIVIFTIMLSIIAITAWLWNKEIDAALKRALESEAALKEERDLLEVRVEERTQQLKESQLEKISNLYRFVEFGRLATGLFHDLMNPITAVSLNIESMNKNVSNDVKKDLDRVITASKRMNNFMQAIKKQIQKQEVQTSFSINTEINQVMQIVAYKARKNMVDITFAPTDNLFMYGNPLKFHQSMVNILSNAIDAYEGLENEVLRRHEIHIDIRSDDNVVQITIQDWGCGIEGNSLSQIFDPFYTTKAIDKGTGIGLSNTKQIIEKTFGGNISVVSQKGMGTLFTIKLPKQQVTTP
jgi:signal transduction histidine kinase